jgi:hypothetical protein
MRLDKNRDKDKDFMQGVEARVNFLVPDACHFDLGCIIDDQFYFHQRSIRTNDKLPIGRFISDDDVWGEFIFQLNEMRGCIKRDYEHIKEHTND